MLLIVSLCECSIVQLRTYEAAERQHASLLFVDPTPVLQVNLLMTAHYP